MEIRYQTYRAAASKLVFPVPGSSSVVGAACHVRAASKPEQSARIAKERPQVSEISPLERAKHSLLVLML